MKGLPISEIDEESTLIKNITILETLEDKKMSAKAWVGELASQVYVLNKVCLAQQIEIEALKKLCWQISIR